jgi:TonB family protein
MMRPMKWAVLGIMGLLVIAVGDVSARSQRAPVRRAARSPVYPVDMEGTGLDGHVELIFVVETDGTVHNPKVRSASHAAFGDAALGVVKSWRFKPGIRDGRIVSMRVTQPFIFYAGPVRKVNAILGRVVFKNIDEIIYSPVEVGGLPEIAYEPITRYPRKLLGSGQTEVIYVDMTVGPDGRGYNIEIEGYPPKDFIFPAYLAASHYRFKPVVHNGQSVYVYTRVAIVISEDVTDRQRQGRGYAIPIGDPDDAYPDYPDF